MYRRVRERGMAAFKERLAFSSERKVPQASFATDLPATLLLPDLPEVWDYLADAPKLGAYAKIQKGFEFLGKDDLEGRQVESKTKRPGWIRAILRADDGYSICELPTRVWIDYSEETLRRRGGGANPGTAQVILNYARVAREAWRLKAVVDEKGYAVSSRFLVFRPKPGGPTLRVLWAILNSPVANAYAYCFSGKRETLVKEWRAFPLPAISPARARGIAGAVTEYLAAAQKAQDAFMKPMDKKPLRQALLAMDAEVLRSYDLPPRLERQLLDLFEGVERKGVGCEFKGYYQSSLDAFVPLHELISDEYARSTMEEFRQQRPLDSSSPVLAALRSASEAFAEE